MHDGLMRDRLIELIGEYHAHPERFCPRMETDQPCSGCKYDLGFECNQDGKLADHLLANGVIVPPCKVGQTVYRVSFVHKTVEMLKVEGFLRNVASWKVHCMKFIPKWLGNQKEHIYIQFSAFGKTVFLTCEEAEKALAERSNENG